jgi:beta-aspartyl-peptidase (threonine type)
MKNTKTLLLAMLVLAILPLSHAQDPPAWAIVIHGGAGNISPTHISPDRADAIAGKLGESLEAGIAILEKGGSSLDAVEAAIRMMEDSPLFNAGKGAVFTHEGRNELDASIMEGKTLMAGAVAGVGDIKNPISAARIVMEKSPHVLLTGAGASRFVSRNGAEIVDSSYFFTERRWEQLQRQLKKAEVEKYGTVGCVALDKKGNLAAGTSTGGMTNKRFGRIGDSPIIGAGNYANNNSCAVSATGHGEFFIRYTVAHDISALMQYSSLTLREAARKVIHEKLKMAGGSGGVICIDRLGNIAMEFNTSGMLRAFATAGGDRGIKVFE